MDKGFRCLGFTANGSSLNAFGRMSKTVQVGGEYYTDTTLRLDTPGACGMYMSTPQGTKRKANAVDGKVGLKDGSSLVLGLGHPLSSSDSKGSSATACTISSAKETDEESSMDLDLNFNLNLGNEKLPSLKKPRVAALKPLETRLSFDLALSLSTGPSESEMTGGTPSSTQCPNSFEIPRMISKSLTGDEGSASSHWKIDSVVSDLPTAQASYIISPVSSKPDVVQAGLGLSPTLVSMPKSSVTCTSGLTQSSLLQRSSNSKTCQFKGCGKGARGASGLCIAHGGGRRCQKAGCHKGAEGRTVYCKAHGGGRRCQFLGCTKSAEGRTDYCIAHGGGRRCSHEGCTRAARGKSGLCIRHGGGKRCQRENCTRSAEGFSGLCISHGGGRRCQYQACSKGAQGSTMFCKAHGGGKRCTVLGCTKGAEGSTPFCKGHGGGKRCSFQGGSVCPKSVHGGTQFCVAHGGGKRCAVAGCTKSARGRTDFCVRHGGGKRCKFEGCGKSAQGSTDFCKAHGGGKRCTWGQSGSERGVETSCDRFARGKTGLCAAHNALVQDRRVHGGGTLGPTAQVPKSRKSGNKTGVDVEDMHVDYVNMGNKAVKFAGWNGSDSRCSHPGSISMKLAAAAMPTSGEAGATSSSVSLPEGRVHGGSLMALLAGGVGNQVEGGGPSEHGSSFCTVAHKWM